MFANIKNWCCAILCCKFFYRWNQNNRHFWNLSGGGWGCKLIVFRSLTAVNALLPYYLGIIKSRLHGNNSRTVYIFTMYLVNYFLNVNPFYLENKYTLIIKKHNVEKSLQFLLWNLLKKKTCDNNWKCIFARLIFVAFATLINFDQLLLQQLLLQTRKLEIKWIHIIRKLEHFSANNICWSVSLRKLSNYAVWVRS